MMAVILACRDVLKIQVNKVIKYPLRSSVFNGYFNEQNNKLR